jgi:MFS family permease
MSLPTSTALGPRKTGVDSDMPGQAGRNFNLGVISGIAFNLYTAILGTELVMTWFLSEITDSNLLISLLIPIELGSWYFLQLLLSGYVQRQPLAMPLYRSMGIVRVAALGLLTATTFSLDQPNALLVVFMAAFTANSVAAGVAALPFLNIVAKTIPPRRRGMYFGWRRTVGGLLGIVGGVLVKMILAPDSGWEFPTNYAVLFLVGFVITIVLVGSFSLVREPRGVAESQKYSLREQMKRAVRLPARDRSYDRYLRLRLAMVAAGYALPFYAVYARRELDAPQDMVAFYVICSTLAGVVFNTVSGRLGDTRGNLLVLRLAALTTALPAGLALSVASAPHIWHNPSLVFGLVFVAQGLHIAARSIGSINYVLELAPPVERPIFVGFANGVVGVAVFASPVGGMIVDWVGFEALFAFALLCAVFAIWFSLGLEEPRTRNGIGTGECLGPRLPDT